tara:strand:- start:414 stop:1103 length:690 start_codon:yes stop_codon:yes gene_type:complete
MKIFFKQLIPPLFLKLYRDIYFYFLINKNKKKISKDQDIDIYNKSLTAEKLSEWGKETTWNEIQMFFDDKEGKILDVACGTGLNIIDLLRINSKASLYGCDISQFLIDIAVKNGVKKENLFCIDATELNFEENFFDYSYSIGSMEHFTEDGIDKLIEKLSKITKKTSIHMMPVSKKNINEGWIKTYQTFHNNSVEWWVEKFRKKFSKVDVIDSSWSDHISVGKWFVCYK